MKKLVKRHEVQQPLDKPYRFIPLTQGQNAIVDASDFEWLSQWNWCAFYMPNTKSFYAGRSCNPRIYMHKEILRCRTREVDHENLDTLDNRRDNLRRATVSQNHHNSRIPVNNTSGYKGVSFRKDRTKWSANIKVNGRQKNLGLFDSAKEAAQTRSEMARIMHGKFARD